MDWQKAIDRQSEALRGIVAALFAMLEAAGYATAERIPRPLRLAVLNILRPAESAVRRLIVIAARGLVVEPSPSRPFPKGLARGSRTGGRVSFPLFDRRKNFAPPRTRRPEPRIWVLDDDPIVPFFKKKFGATPARAPAPPDDGFVDARRLSSRLLAIRAVLDDLPRHARRLVRLIDRREKANIFPTCPMRPGRAPGHRKRHVHPVDEVLADCQAIARWALVPDTS